MKINIAALAGLLITQTAMGQSKEFDYIIIGAGAAGPVVASRLSENPRVRVAILEAGGENTNDLSRIGGAFFLAWAGDYNWAYKTVPQTQLGGRQIDHPRGRVIGGSTAINVGLWARGTRDDYDSWGVPGWSYQKALEKFRTIEDTGRGPNEFRGKGGMVHMEDSPDPSPISRKLMDAYVEAGFGVKGDPNGANPMSTALMEKIYRNNVRRTPADSYLSPEVRRRPNLSVVTRAFVTRIVFEGRRAAGVEVEIDGVPTTIRAAKEVIVSAGAFNTPKLLKLSGVGPRAELERLGIPVVADVPGVGENLRDHAMVMVGVVAPEGVTGSVPIDIGEEAIARWRKDHTGPANNQPMNALGFVSVGSEIDKPDFELIFDYNPADGAPAGRSGYQIGISQLIPESRGSVTLSSRNPHDAPVIDPRYFSDPRDMRRMVEAVRKVLLLTRTGAMAPYTESVDPAPTASDSEIERFIRAGATTVFHPSGTARMGDTARDSMAVVDHALRVRGVQGLRVADASILPQVNRGHTMAPTVFIGEMAAEWIAQDM